LPTSVAFRKTNRCPSYPFSGPGVFSTKKPFSALIRL
jgi:hypothetical protein